MNTARKIKDDLWFIGANDRKLSLFEAVYPVPEGVSYNSYLLLDEKNVLFDTVDSKVSDIFFENLREVLNGKELDYLVVNHMEPDHCSQILNIKRLYPDVKIVCNKKTVDMISAFFDGKIDGNSFIIVNEGDILNTGKHELTFVFAPMVHWPEVMATYDKTDKILFSADAFGSFGAVSGNIFADEIDFERDYLPEARRYYTNIVGKYGNQVQALLKKASNLKIEMICPLHGHIWRKNFSLVINKYIDWATYTPEEKGVLIAYSSVYGNTQKAAEILAGKLSDKGISKIKTFDVSMTHPSYVISEAFRFSHIVFATTTYNAGIFVTMENLVREIAAHNLQNRTIAVIQNGSWAPVCTKLIRKELECLKNINFIEPELTLRSAVSSAQDNDFEMLADDIFKSMYSEQSVETASTQIVDRKSLNALSYGLFVLSSKDGEKDNACIINTSMQICDNPATIVVSVNKSNLTHDMIMKTGKFNISILTTDTPFEIFERFGFASGRDKDKFEGFEFTSRTENGILYLNKYSNSVISGTVENTIDCGTHTIFYAKISEAKVLSETPSVTYSYYYENIKPGQKQLSDKKGWVCEVCGYVYEGENLPSDFICPLCKHGISAFKKLG